MFSLSCFFYKPHPFICEPKMLCQVNQPVRFSWKSLTFLPPQPTQTPVTSPSQVGADGFPPPSLRRLASAVLAPCLPQLTDRELRPGGAPMPNNPCAVTFHHRLKDFCQSLDSFCDGIQIFPLPFEPKLFPLFLPNVQIRQGLLAAIHPPTPARGCGHGDRTVWLRPLLYP